MKLSGLCVIDDADFKSTHKLSSTFSLIFVTSWLYTDIFRRRKNRSYALHTSLYRVLLCESSFLQAAQFGPQQPSASSVDHSIAVFLQTYDTKYSQHIKEAIGFKGVADRQAQINVWFLNHVSRSMLSVQRQKHSDTLPKSLTIFCHHELKKHTISNYLLSCAMGLKSIHCTFLTYCLVA